MKKLLLLLPTGFVVSTMLMSCTSHLQQPTTYKQAPGVYPFVDKKKPPMETEITAAVTEVIVTDIDQGASGKLKLIFDHRDDSCKVKGSEGSADPQEEINCDVAGAELETEMYFCGPPKKVGHKYPNSIVNGTDVYCGFVKYLSEGADIQFKGNWSYPSKQKLQEDRHNSKCKEVLGRAICY